MDFEGIEPEAELMVSLGKTMGLQVDEEDVTDLLTEHSVELRTEELKEIHEQQHTEAQQEIHREETRAEEVSICMSDIKEVLAIWITFFTIH